MLQIDVLTLFPQSMAGVLGESIIGAGMEKGYLAVDFYQIRDYTQSKQARVDDAPYGGGMGMLMQADPLYRAHKAVCEKRGKAHIHTIYLSPHGAIFNQQTAKKLSVYDGFILVCGHYEGVDRRFLDACVDEEISMGDFVLTGGEIPAMAVIDAVGRLLPGVLADASCFTDESHWNGLLEYPHYTRPEVWNGRAVPEVLLSGNHENIRKWRRREALLATKTKRPDMWEKFSKTPEDRKLLEEK